MNERQSRILAAIIDEFISTALPVGSKQIVERGGFTVSCATVRNEMQVLSDEGFITQPHISAGRVPTSLGYKVYVKDHMKPTKHEKAVRQRFDTLKDVYLKQKDQERVFEAVALLNHMIPNVAFATVPHKDRIYYLGLSNVLKTPECQSNPVLGSGLAEVLEEHLTSLLEQIEVDDHTRYYIGEDNILEQIHSCSMIVRNYQLRDFSGVIGVLGPMRMDYGYNTVALECVCELLDS